MTLEHLRRCSVFLPLFAVLVLSCSNQDVRIGMADGGGTRLSYRVVGEGEVLVVIHDGPGGEKTILYEGFDGLAGRLRVVYYDQRGCGRSEPLGVGESCTIDDNVEDLEALRTFLHTKQFSIAAHGWGAVIAVEYARKYPGHVGAMVLVTPVSPYAPGLHIEDLVSRLPEDGQRQVQAVLDNPFASMLDKREHLVRVVMPLLFHDEGVRQRVDFERLRYSPDVDSRLSAELKTFNLFGRLGDVATPTLIIAGRHDVLTPLAEQMAYVDGIGSSRAVVFNESGHYPFLEESAAFASCVGTFVASRGIPSIAGVQKPPE